MIVPFANREVKENLYLWSAEPGEMEITQLHCAAACDTNRAAGLSCLSFNCPLPAKFNWKISKREPSEGESEAEDVRPGRLITSICPNAVHSFQGVIQPQVSRVAEGATVTTSLTSRFFL